MLGWLVVGRRAAKAKEPGESQEFWRRGKRKGAGMAFPLG
jgi:hypothetical protein